MLQLVLTILLASVLITGIVIDSNKEAKSESGSNEVHNVLDEREDYGCIHEDHSQYDDGDSINLDYLNSNVDSF